MTAVLRAFVAPSGCVAIAECMEEQIAQAGVGLEDVGDGALAIKGVTGDGTEVSRSPRHDFALHVRRTTRGTPRPILRARPS